MWAEAHNIETTQRNILFLQHSIFLQQRQHERQYHHAGGNLVHRMQRRGERL